MENKEQIIMVHNSMMGGSARIARSFNYPVTSIHSYYEGEGNKIVLIVRQQYLTESIMPELDFIGKHYKQIIGVIIADDKCNGPIFGEKAHTIRTLGLPIITIIDRILTLDQKIYIERWLERHAK